MSILPDVMQLLATTPARWAALAERLSEQALTARPAPEEWSAAECLQHLLDTEQMFNGRVEAFLAGRDFPGFDPRTDSSEPIRDITTRDLAGIFDDLRRQSLERLGRLTPEDLERQVRHAQFGPITLREQLHAWAAHDLAHTRQAEQALMQPFIAGSGPLRVRFADHVVGQPGS